MLQRVAHGGEGAQQVELQELAPRLRGPGCEAADEALNRLKTLRPAWTLAKELERNPFVRPEDRQRWEDGMKRAKFS